MNAPRTSPTFNLARKASLLAAVLVGALAGGLPTSAVAYCIAGEVVDMKNPVVTVIDGPGDAATEQARWSSVGNPLALYGEYEIWLGQVSYVLEAAP